jgi:dGTPase
MLTREQLETNEDKVLAPYGMRSRDSQGRAYPDKEPNYRTSFQRDRDRVLHTSAFRRLEYKTQVFINFEGDYFRTRLTHTLEVAQIGRTIARALGANEDLIEVICLAHDLGHAAFGHSGEATLNTLMREHGGFDHNRQSLRIVTELNLEAQIANAADELAYTSHDLDDGLRSGMITPADCADLELWQLLLKNVGWDGEHLDDLMRHRLIRKLIGLLVSDVVTATDARIQASGAKSALDIQKLDHSVIGYSDQMQKRNRQLKDFLFKYLYNHPRVVRMHTKAEKVLTDIFNAYANTPAMLPYDFQEFVAARGLPRTVCDYLAGMTDRYAIQEYEKLFDPHSLP